MVVDAKAQLRAQMLAARRAMSPEAREVAGAEIRRAVLDLPEVMAARTVAAYLSIGTEPATTDLLDALRARGVQVLLPVLRADRDLDWARYDGAHALVPTGRGPAEPAGPRLGVDAIAFADVVLAPGLAVDGRGRRLGRGGGSYDRALARVRAGHLVVALLYDGEVLPVVPAETHDRTVAAVVTPSGAWRFSSGP